MTEWKKKADFPAPRLRWFTRIYICIANFVSVFQIRVAGYRVSDPAARAYGFIVVNVNRNPTVPRFVDRFVFNISETQTLGEVFGTVTAVDPDNVSMEPKHAWIEMKNNPLFLCLFSFVGVGAVGEGVSFTVWQIDLLPVVKGLVKHEHTRFSTVKFYMICRSGTVCWQQVCKLLPV